MGIAELRRKLEKIKINSKGDAEKLFDEVYGIETAAKQIKGGTIAAGELLNKVVMQAFSHKDYMLSVQMLVNTANEAGKDLDIEDVEKKMMQIYRIGRYNKNDGDSDDDSEADEGTEKAMYAGGDGG
eukprot:scaffold4541_cov262-Chaetoceros_neogracile.AAC.1